MARCVFFTWDGGGNQPPATGIAQALRDRGHDVVFAGYSAQESRLRARGWPFVTLHRSSAAWQALAPSGLFDAKLRSVWAAVEHRLDVENVLFEQQPDALVVDCLMFGALAALEGAGMPTMVLVHSAPGALMPPHGPFEAKLLDAVNQVRVTVNRPRLNELWAAWQAFPTVCTSVRELDPLGASAPQSFDFIGPVTERVQPAAWAPPWSPADRRPLVLASFSTGPYWDQRSRIERTLRALADKPYRVLCTAGSTDISGMAIPANAVIATDLPHVRALPHAAITITHAGHGTVAASLMHGVPLVCLPNPAADQPALASRVQALGAGLALDGDSASPEEIAAAVQTVLAQTSFASSARGVAAIIASSPGVAAVADRLEQLLLPLGRSRGDA